MAIVQQRNENIIKKHKKEQQKSHNEKSRIGNLGEVELRGGEEEKSQRQRLVKRLVVHWNFCWMRNEMGVKWALEEAGWREEGREEIGEAGIE